MRMQNIWLASVIMKIIDFDDVIPECFQVSLFPMNDILRKENSISHSGYSMHRKIKQNIE